MTLDVIRGIKNDYFFAIKDTSAKIDTLCKLSVITKTERKTGEKFMEWNEVRLAANHSGEIMALEMDPLCTKDQDCYENADDEFGNQKVDKLYLIDSKLSLFKLAIQGSELTILSRTPLKQHEALSAMLESKLRLFEFQRVAICERTISFYDQTCSTLTGHVWDIENDIRPRKVIKKTKNVLALEAAPFSNLQIAVMRRDDFEKPLSQQYSIMLKNNPSSRKLTTFDSKRKFVKKFEMIGEETLLAEL